MKELDKTGFGGARRIKEYVAPKIEKIKEDVDRKFSFPKMLTGLAFTIIATVVKIFIPAVPFMDWLFVTGISMLLASLGLVIKLDRLKKGGTFWKNEMALWDFIIKSIRLK